MVSPLAGKPVPAELLIDVEQVIANFEQNSPDVSDPQQRVSFGTSGHRGTAEKSSFTRAHILAITQAICDYRASRNINGPLFMGKDTHALSAPAEKIALEVLAANGVETFIQEKDGVTPTPVISRAILCHNRDAGSARADGIVITPSHNPPSDGGFKYNPPHGGPADTDITSWIQDRANELLEQKNSQVKRIPLAAALNAETTHKIDFARPYVEDLKSVVDLDVIRRAGLKLGSDPLGGSCVGYWDLINARYELDITVVNPSVDPAFSFMTVDHDGKVRMDCSSPFAMASLVKLKDSYDLAFGNDPDSDRHGIVAKSSGLMNPNHYLAVAVSYLFSQRSAWPAEAAVGKTLVSSSIIDRVAESLGRRLWEVPVGFKWFVNGLFDGSCGFGGEESAGASFLRLDGSVWTTDKDGIIMNLLAAEITARTGKDPGEHFSQLADRFGMPYYSRVDRPASAEQKARLKNMGPEAVTANELAGEKILAKHTKAPGNQAAIGGLKVVAESGWFAARPSGTENIYKIYAESFRDQQHLELILEQAAAIVDKVFQG